MKEKFLNKSISYIKKNRELDHYSEVKIKYGLEVLYHFLTKLIFIIALSIILKIHKEVLLMIIFYAPLRACVHGIHSNSNIGCWISTIIDYILFGLYIKYVSIKFSIFLIMSLITITSYILYAPADTKFRPLVGEKNRKKLKMMAVIIFIIEFIMGYYFKYITSYVYYAFTITSIIINPTLYYVTKNNVNNYRNYDQ